jgi:hypothetical protein
MIARRSLIGRSNELQAGLAVHHALSIAVRSQVAPISGHPRSKPA